jgi:hypothetical protein
MSIGRMVVALNEVKHDRGLTEWEKEFITHCYNKSHAGARTFMLSGPEAEKVDEVYSNFLRSSNESYIDQPHTGSS